MNGLDLLLIVIDALLLMLIVGLRIRVDRLERSIKLVLNVRYGRIMQAHPKGDDE